jgi:hypothetical protein
MAVALKGGASMRRGAVAAILSLVGAGAALAAPEEAFQVRDTRDLVALCSVAPGHPNYTAAIHFCHGFGVGAYQYYQLLEAGIEGYRFVCINERRPSRDEAVASFVAWAGAHPESHDDPAVDSLFRWLGETYPCS